ncbi:uncharacterized protein LOC111706085 [Eurytemora carolleeae]|uniref:uncharacterized protein LOC111706085 n=1 Tax=Eurytemora carolleeae TaxID=1294199 RepID=UPI000C781C21|nr:uncharacterized protein LOC111706085 [Eurytemora carolleeae]|eukprot:XP_023334619.1 uncharacterized protein LOC111706085 [Eurytemora affinis]
MRKHYADRYYGPEEGDSQYIREQRVDSGSFGRDYILHRGKRPDRYFGPESGIKEKRFRAVHDGDDQPYQGPTIFDKVFRQHSRKSSTDEPVSVSRSVSPEIRKRKFPRSPDDEGKSKYKSRRMSPDSDEDKAKEELEAEWLKYKEKTEAKIRREKKKLMKYEERINHLENLTQNEQVRLKPLDIEKYERRKRKLESSGKRSKSRGRDSSYEPDPVISRSPPRYRGTPPPGADLRPVLIEGDGEYISEDEYDSNYSDYKPAGRIHDAYKNY